MPDSANPADASLPSHGGGSWSRAEIDAAIAGLDRATRRFTSRAEEINRPPPPVAPTPSPTPSRAALPDLPAADPLPRPRHADSFDEQMREAERAAREYLDRAKARADSLVRTMIGAVEREAAEIKQEAEQGIREHWRVVQVEADRHLSEARRVADGIVGERQSLLGELSDGIVGRAEALTVGLEDADRIRAQFEEFVRSLSEASNRIAEEAADQQASGLASLGERAGGLRNSPLAA